MSSDSNFTDVLAQGQAISVDPALCQCVERDDGTLQIIFQDVDGIIEGAPGVTYFGPLRSVSDDALPDGAGLVAVVRNAPGAASSRLPRDSRTALNSPELTVEGFDALLRDNPDLATIVKLTNRLMVARAEADAIADGLGQAGGMRGRELEDFLEFLRDEAVAHLNTLSDQGELS